MIKALTKGAANTQGQLSQQPSEEVIMSARKSNAGRRLRQLKNQYQQQLRQLKEEFNDQLLVFEDALQSQLYSQAFYHEALMNLLTSENEPDSDTLIGAMVIKRWLRQSGADLSQQMAQARQ